MSTSLGAAFMCYLSAFAMAGCCRTSAALSGQSAGRLILVVGRHKNYECKCALQHICIGPMHVYVQIAQ